MIKDDKIASLIYNILLDWQYLENHKRLGRVWRKTWNHVCDRFTSMVSTNIHGRRAIVNFGHSYPLFARRYKHLNNPLVELVYQTHLSKQRPINIIDIGAAIGDTVLLIEANCPHMVSNYYCIEGESEFYALLIENVGTLDAVHPINVMLSDKPESIPNLTRSHAGTASAQGNESVQAVTLDSLFDTDVMGAGIDILKIDVDGYDGRVLRGARNILAKRSPAVIFEWDPYFCQKTNNSWLDHFIGLNEIGYSRFIWFSKYGEFSHFTTGCDEASINRMAAIILSNKHDTNWHYDIIALPDSAPEMEEQLSALSFAKNKPSSY
jgi:FkbM family methyltransferase